MQLLLRPTRSWLLSLLILLSFSCRIQLVPVYSAELEKQVADAAKATDKLYLQIIDADTEEQRSYAHFKDAYMQLESEINSILLKNEAREKNKDFIEIINNLKKAFAEAKEFHKTHTTLRVGEAKGYQASLAGFWAPLYVAEMALKDPQTK